MALLRRHIRPILVYLFGATLLMLAGTLVLVYLHSPVALLRAMLYLLMPVSSLAPLAVVLPLFYRRSDAGRKAEWAVLAPALMAGIILGTHWSGLASLVDWLPPGPAPASYFVIRGLINLVFVFGTALLCVALVARYMSRLRPPCSRAGLGRFILAVSVMVIVVSLADTAARAAAAALQWGIGQTLQDSLQTLYLKSALIAGTSLLAISVTWIAAANWLLRETDELSRWSATAAIASWVALSGWMFQFRIFSPWGFDSGYTPLFESEPYAQIEFFVRLFLTNVFWGALAAVPALLYARCVAYRMGLKPWEPEYFSDSP